MIKLELKSELGTDQLVPLTAEVSKQLGRASTYDFSDDGIAVDSGGSILYRGYTMLKRYSPEQHLVAFTKVGEPLLYVAYFFKLLENTEWDNEF
ncbi:hypothetical protein KKB83_03750 [Patescibacteria group bacterium]|nr:hypothetical protein [Patescibacteria group bacterium]